jgi:N-acetyl-anhydromuramyl-L-alanine amidase AmpD
MKIIQVPFKDYYHEEGPKSQIYLHHTAGTGKGDDVYRWWGSDKPRVATCVIIDRDGTIKQGFNSKYWAYHLGLANKHFKAHSLPYLNLDRVSIGIELISWGILTKKGEKYLNYVGGVVPVEEVEVLDKPFRGSKYYHKYTDAQLEGIADLLRLWNKRYNIDITYKEDIWDVCPRALRGEKGVFTHCSVRPDKSDVFPQKNLIELLRSL